MQKVWVLQHVACETLGTIADALKFAGISPEYIRTFKGEPVPGGMEAAAGLIVMGGPMGVYDHPRCPFLSDEMRLIERALWEEKPVLGVCLGSQLLAAVLGAAVTKGVRKEIGWRRVTLTASAAEDRLWAGLEPSFMAYHWHGDVFALPGGALSLASSGLTECQAFRYGRNAYGLLFHLEVTAETIGDMVRTFADELREEGIDGREISGEAKAHLPRLREIGGAVFQRWAELVSC